MPARGPEQPFKLLSSRTTQSRVQGGGESGSQGRRGDVPAGLGAAASLRRPAAAHAGVWGATVDQWRLGRFHRRSRPPLLSANSQQSV